MGSIHRTGDLSMREFSTHLPCIFGTHVLSVCAHVEGLDTNFPSCAEVVTSLASLESLPRLYSASFFRQFLCARLRGCRLWASSAAMMSFTATTTMIGGGSSSTRLRCHFWIKLSPLWLPDARQSSLMGIRGGDVWLMVVVSFHVGNYIHDRRIMVVIMPKRSPGCGACEGSY